MKLFKLHIISIKLDFFKLEFRLSLIRRDLKFSFSFSSRAKHSGLIFVKPDVNHFCLFLVLFLVRYVSNDVSSLVFSCVNIYVSSYVSNLARFVSLLILHTKQCLNVSDVCRARKHHQRQSLLRQQLPNWVGQGRSSERCQPLPNHFYLLRKGFMLQRPSHHFRLWGFWLRRIRQGDHPAAREPMHHSSWWQRKIADLLLLLT